ncbi:MAG: hypothetical protein DDT31_00759 [Syntrophomonadaceae bacterium]|nr:hypothetical protein [Bacillota bacterium]
MAPIAEQLEETGSIQPLTPVTPSIVCVEENACPETQQPDCDSHVITPVSLFLLPLKLPGPATPLAEQVDEITSIQPGTPDTPLTVAKEALEKPGRQQPDCAVQTVTPVELFLIPVKAPEPEIP